MEVVVERFLLLVVELGVAGTDAVVAVVELGEGSWACPGLGSELRLYPVEVSPH